MYKETVVNQNILKHFHFNSIHELTQFIENTPVSSIFLSKSILASRRIDSRGWAGTRTYEEALELLKKGWIPESERLAKKIPINNIAVQKKRVLPQYSVAGYQASVPRYLQGIPTNMITSKVTAKKQKIITIYKSLSYNSATSSETIKEEGVKALQIIQGLEAQGYRTKLIMYWASGCFREACVMSLAIKRPEERLSLAKSAFPLAHPAMLRRIGFAFMERHPHLTENTFSQGYGVSNGDLFKPTDGIVLPSFIPDVAKFIKEAFVSE